ncbi:hypothetical protein GZH82_13575 [Staphylococcus ursi]|uniref:hypothetical protein n=1 Tax=Staphylococcus sp. MI 10-1553 TaxID=1912064 RepID=UPI001398C654|nr:hypothetical protein [Staphylococcus sp. MI 10-1553]QHW38271.1 hypothetical protein GZH82_13575 [Staphylococcus sp. MI 10-1553]
MTNKIKIQASTNNRYKDRRFNKNNITVHKFKLFMEKIDTFINILHQLISINKNLFSNVYNRVCMLINNDLINFTSKPEYIRNVKELIEASFVNSLESYNSKFENLKLYEEKVLYEVYVTLEKLIDDMKSLYDQKNDCIGKLRGIMMEGLCISIFGTVHDFKDNRFIWDFNAYEEETLIVKNGRQTSDIYFENVDFGLVSEVKCRPRQIDESQVDYVNYLSERISITDKFTPRKIIFHGGTLDDYNSLQIGFKEKLKDFQIYCQNSIDSLIKIL